MCMYTLHSDEVVSLISGDESVVYSCSPMQWMLHYTAIPAIIITSRGTRWGEIISVSDLEL